NAEMPPDADQIATSAETVSRPVLLESARERTRSPRIWVTGPGAMRESWSMSWVACAGSIRMPARATRKSRNGNSASRPKKVTIPATSLTRSLVHSFLRAVRNSFHVIPCPGKRMPRIDDRRGSCLIAMASSMGDHVEHRAKRGQGALGRLDAGRRSARPASEHVPHGEVERAPAGLRGDGPVAAEHRRSADHPEPRAGARVPRVPGAVVHRRLPDPPRVGEGDAAHAHRLPEEREGERQPPQLEVGERLGVAGEARAGDA